MNAALDQFQDCIDSRLIQEWNPLNQLLVVDTQLYKRLCWSVDQFVYGDRAEKCKNAHFWCCHCDCLCMSMCLGWLRVWMGFVCPCPPIRNDIVTPLHLFCVFSHIYKRSCPPICWLVGLSTTQMLKLLKTNVSYVLFIPVTSKKLPTSISIQSLFILSFIHSFIHSFNHSFRACFFWWQSHFERATRLLATFVCLQRSLHSLRSLAPQCFASLRLLCSLAPCTGLLTYFALSLVGQLK